jgi:peroxiredoxin
MAISKFCLFVIAALATVGCASSHKTAISEPGSEPLILASADGSTVKLDELWRDHKATVLVFWSGGCPCVRRYQDRTDALLDQYPADQVRVLGVSSNAGESFEDVKRVAKERRVRTPIFRDEGGHVAEAVGARSTPTVVVIDGRGNVRFRGWIDNERLPGVAGREPYLDHAIRGVLEARSDFAERSPIYGCTITRSIFGTSSDSCCCCNHHK